MQKMEDVRLLAKASQLQHLVVLQQLEPSRTTIAAS